MFSRETKIRIPFIGNELIFPSLHKVEPHGIVAMGGDLSVERLLLAYSQGIFPWYEKEPILWWSPPQRLIIEPANLHIGRTLQKVLRKNKFLIQVDTAFSEVIKACAQIKRPGQEGTWITKEMKQAYNHLHDAGYAHSVEVYEEGQLVGGLYGVSLGSAFFGESMFSLVSSASQIAFIFLARLLKLWGFSFIDCQVYTKHMDRLGGVSISRDEFLERLNQALQSPTRKGSWCFDALNLL